MQERGLAALHLPADHLQCELAREPSVDAVFVACTSLRLAAVVEEIERASGKPALSSNHAMAWHALRLAGYRDPVPGFGRLFRI